MAAIYAEVAKHPRYGYRLITNELRRDGWRVNAKRVYRLWRREGLKVARKARKQWAKGGSANSVKNRPSQHMNDVWALDFIHDSTPSGGSLKMLVIEDEFTRECLALEVRGGRFGGWHVAEILAELFAIRGVPVGLRSDNGKEFIGRAVSRIVKAAGVNPLLVEAGCPWENGVVESLNSIIRDDLERSPQSDPGVMRVSSRLEIERNSHEAEASHAPAGGSQVAGGPGVVVCRA